jgi:hypothetical protein
MGLMGIYGINGVYGVYGEFFCDFVWRFGNFLYLCSIQFGEVGEPSGPTSLFYWKSKVFISSPLALLNGINGVYGEFFCDFVWRLRIFL